MAGMAPATGVSGTESLSVISVPDLINNQESWTEESGLYHFLHYQLAFII